MFFGLILVLLLFKFIKQLVIEVDGLFWLGDGVDLAETDFPLEHLGLDVTGV